MDNMLKEYIEKLKSVDTVEEYEAFISKLHQMMKQESYKNDIVQNIRNKQKYMVNKFSKESTRENMLKAKENLLIYLDSILCEEHEKSSQFIQRELERYLRNFYFFLEAFREVNRIREHHLLQKICKKYRLKMNMIYSICFMQL